MREQGPVVESCGEFPMSGRRIVWQSESQNEVLSLMFKAYILSLVLVLVVLVWSASDAWAQYDEFCEMAGSFFKSNYTNF